MKVLKGWLDLDLKNHGDSSLCINPLEIGKKYGLEVDESLLGQLKEYDEKHVKITIEEI